MRPTTSKNLAALGAATLGALCFWTALDTVHPMRPNEPHPGLRDAALKSALRADHEKQHKNLPYVQARKLLFSDIDGNGRSATCRYTGEEIKYMLHPLPNKAAVEHAWPLTRLPAEARSDLHHMFVAIPDARIARLNLHYGAVVVPVWEQGGSRSGPSNRVVPVFEVRKDERGDVARAMFHVSTMYDLAIPEAEERVLRTWSEQDPVSKQESQRNERIAAKQGSRNPFIDHPTMVNRIKNF